jgi:PEP-CTERM motif
MTKMFKCIVLAIVTATALFGVSDRVSAGYLFQNLITEVEYVKGDAWNVDNGHVPYVNFMAAETGHVSEVFAAIWQTGSDLVQLTLTDSTNQVLEVLSGVAPYFDNPVQVWHLVSVNQPLLIQGEQYRLTATYSGSGLVGWDYTRNSLHSGVSPLYLSTPLTVGVDVLDTTAVPEPSTFALLGLGVLGAVIHACRRLQFSM